MKLDYTLSLMPQTGCLGKICEPTYSGQKLTMSAFLAFFRFFDVEETFCLHKYRVYQAGSFPFFGPSLQKFPAESLQKTD